MPSNSEHGSGGQDRLPATGSNPTEGEGLRSDF